MNTTEDATATSRIGRGARLSAEGLALAIAAGDLDSVRGWVDTQCVHHGGRGIAEVMVALAEGAGR